MARPGAGRPAVTRLTRVAVARGELSVPDLGNNLPAILGALAIATRSLPRELTGAARNTPIAEQRRLTAVAEVS